MLQQAGWNLASEVFPWASFSIMFLKPFFFATAGEVSAPAYNLGLTKSPASCLLRGEGRLVCHSSWGRLGKMGTFSSVADAHLGWFMDQRLISSDILAVMGLV